MYEGEKKQCDEPVCGLRIQVSEKDDIEECELFYEKLLYLLVKMKEGMKTIEELKTEVYQHGLNEHIREVFLGVLEDADVASLPPKEREIYDRRLKRYRDNHACLDYAIEKGIRQGIEQGMEKGIAQGIEKGIEQGKDRRSLEIAKNLKLKCVPYETIADCTGLGIEQIESL